MQQYRHHKNESTIIQTEMEVGQENDVLEQEADQMADHVVNTSEGSSGVSGNDENTMTNPKKVQRMTVPKNRIAKKMSTGKPAIQKMTAPGRSGMVAPASVEQGINSSKGSGQQLQKSTQDEIGSKMGADLSGVKVHTDDRSERMNKEIGAKAFTHGNDIFFNKGQYNPQSTEGKHLLTHELTHTVQQSGTVKPKIQRQTVEDPSKQTKKSNTPKAERSLKNTDEKPPNVVRKGEGPFAFVERNEITPEQLAHLNPEVFRNYDKYTDKTKYWNDLSGKNWMIHPGQQLRVEEAEKIVESEFGTISVKSTAVISNASTGESTYGDYKGMGSAGLDGTITLGPEYQDKEKHLYWIQTVRSNLHIISNWSYPLPDLKECEFLDIVTGYEGQKLNTVIGDTLKRPTSPQGTVIWRATTSLVYIPPNPDLSIRVLYTIQWGFDLKPNGDGVTYENIELGKSDLSGSFHEQQIFKVKDHFLNGGPLETGDPCVKK